jgi:hypothetical protein
MKSQSCFPARSWFLGQLFVFLAFSAFLVGCGPSLAPVNGTVTYKGEKVKGGTLVFSPKGEGNVPGPPGTAMVQEDGSYELKSAAGVGTVVGQNTLTYTAPGGTASTDPKKEGIPSPYMGLVPKETSVTVKSGQNTVNVELVRPK